MDVLDAVRERRSVTFFEKGLEIPDDTLQELMELANLAPSSFNLQPWEVVVVRDAERKKILRRYALDQSKVEEASAVLIIVADPDVEVNLNVMLDSWEQLGYIKKASRATITAMVRSRYGTEGSCERKIFAAKNAALFAMSIMLAAQGLGLGTHAMDGFDEAPMKKAFAIPDEKLVPMLIAIGYLRKDALLLPRAFRRSFREFVRFERYEAEEVSG
jgi:putative NAD(P)H nitroreductase